MPIKTSSVCVQFITPCLAGALLPISNCQTPLCRLVKRPTALQDAPNSTNGRCSGFSFELFAQIRAWGWPALRDIAQSQLNNRRPCTRQCTLYWSAMCRRRHGQTRIPIPLSLLRWEIVGKSALRGAYLHGFRAAFFAEQRQHCLSCYEPRARGGA